MSEAGKSPTYSQKCPEDGGPAPPFRSNLGNQDVCAVDPYNCCKYVCDNCLQYRTKGALLDPQSKAKVFVPETDTGVGDKWYYSVAVAV